MKRLLLIISFIAITLFGYSQARRSIFQVPTLTTDFGVALPSGALVQCVADNTIYQLTAVATPTDDLNSIGKVTISSSVADPLNIGSVIATDSLTSDNGVSRVTIFPDKLWIDGTGKTTRIGYQAGNADDLANSRNTFLGYRAGLFFEGDFNTVIGTEAGITCGLSANANTNMILGANAGRILNSSDNTIIGYRAGFAHSATNNGMNVYIGTSAGDQGDGQYTVSIGGSAGYNAASYCTFLGNSAGYYESRDSIIHLTYKTTGTEAGDELFSPYFYNGNEGLTRLNSDSVIISGNSLSVGSLETISSREDVADDGTISLPAKAGKVEVWVNDGTNEETIIGRVYSDGTVDIITGFGNTSNADTDGSLCLFDNAGTPTIKNRLGFAYTICYEFKTAK